MAAMSSLKNLPAGFRLNPRDEDLIGFFLMRKLQNVPDPDGNCLIPEFNIYDSGPWDLIPLFDEMASIKSNGLECFFFCPLYKSPNRRNNIRKIAKGKGYWHETGKGRQPQDTDKLKWAKRIFCHRLGTQRNAKQTEWVMHEFRLISDERFVLCRITKKPKKLLSAFVGKKRKAGSANSEFHQETSPESCILNHLPDKANCEVGSSCQPQDSNGTPSEASVHMNADEVPMIMTPVSDIINTSDDFLLAIMAEALTPESDVISQLYSQTSPNMNMIGDHTMTSLPLETSPESCILNHLPDKANCEIGSSCQPQDSNGTPSEASVHMNVDEVPMIMTPVSDIINTSDDFLLAIMAEALTPESDVISQLHSQTSPNMNMIGDHTMTSLPLETSPESCILNHLPDKANCEIGSSCQPQDSNGTPSEASVHMNVDEVPMIMTPVSDIINTSDDFLLAIMAEALTPESDVISQLHSQTSPNMNMIGDHTMTSLPLDICVEDYDDTEPYTTQVILRC